MKKIQLHSMAFSFLFTLVSSTFAGNIPGDVNFGLDASPDNHAYKFRLIVDGTAATFPTGCVAPNTGLAQALSYGAIGEQNAKLSIQASDCAKAQDNWITLNGFFNYTSSYWYNVFINMNTNSFHL